MRKAIKMLGCPFLWLGVGVGLGERDLGASPVPPSPRGPGVTLALPDRGVQMATIREDQS